MFELEPIDIIARENTVSHALIDEKTGIVESVVEIVDASKLPEAPTEEPVEPVRDEYPNEPVMPNIIGGHDSSNPFVQMHLQKRDDWKKQCEEIDVRFVQAVETYVPEIVDFKKRVQIANKYRWTPPEGFLAVRIPEGISVYQGITVYQDGIFINPKQE